MRLPVQTQDIIPGKVILLCYCDAKGETTLRLVAVETVGVSGFFGRCLLRDAPRRFAFSGVIAVSAAEVVDMHRTETPAPLPSAVILQRAARMVENVLGTAHLGPVEEAMLHDVFTDVRRVARAVA
jgi:hypothetical protein